MRAGGAGIGAFFTPTGVGTMVAEGGLPWRYHPDGTVALASAPKEVRTFHGTEMVLEESIVTDVALVRAAVVDRAGNCVFHASARNFNVPAAMSGRLTIVEAEQRRRGRRDRTRRGPPARRLRAAGRRADRPSRPPARTSRSAPPAPVRRR